MSAKFLTVLAATIALAAAAPLAHAAPAKPAQVIRVDASDLNLSTEAGAHAMLYRIEDAATRACGGWPTRLDHFAQFKGCRDTMVFQAVKDLRSPLVGLTYGETFGDAPTFIASN